MCIFHYWHSAPIEGPLSRLMGHMSIFCLADRCVKCGLYKIEDWIMGEPRVWYYDSKKDRMWE